MPSKSRTLSKLIAFMFIFLILGAVIGALSVVFFLQNTEIISVMFLSFEIESSLAIILAAAFMGGILTTILLSLPSLISDWLEGARLQRRIRQLESELFESKKREETAREFTDRTETERRAPPEHVTEIRLPA